MIGDLLQAETPKRHRRHRSSTTFEGESHAIVQLITTWTVHGIFFSNSHWFLPLLFYMQEMPDISGYDLVINLQRLEAAHCLL